MITSSKSTPIQPIGSDVTLTCTVELSPAVDVPVIVNTSWIRPNGSMNFNTTQLNREYVNNFTGTVFISSFEREQSGNYICLATVIITIRGTQYIYESVVTASNEILLSTGRYY